MKILLSTLAIGAALVFALPALGEETAPGTVGAGKGWFHVDCAYSHRAPDDPIVFPRGVGASHSHDFLGARNLSAIRRTARSARRRRPACDRGSRTPTGRPTGHRRCTSTTRPWRRCQRLPATARACASPPRSSRSLTISASSPAAQRAGRRRRAASGSTYGPVPAARSIRGPR